MALLRLLEVKYDLLRCVCMPSQQGVDCGHFVSCQFGWAGPFPRALFPTLT